MRYLLSHRTSYSYASNVDSAHHIARLRAREFPGQKVSSISIATNPKPALADSVRPAPCQGTRGIRGMGKQSSFLTPVSCPLTPVSPRQRRVEIMQSLRAGLCSFEAFLLRWIPAEIKNLVKLAPAPTALHQIANLALLRVVHLVQ